MAAINEALIKEIGNGGEDDYRGPELAEGRR